MAISFVSTEETSLAGQNDSLMSGFSEGHRHLDRGPFVRLGADLKRSVEGSHALAHADDADVTLDRRLNECREAGKAATVVFDLEPQRCWTVFEADFQAARLGVTKGVRHGFLHDAKA